MSEIRIRKVKLTKDEKIVMEYEKLVNDAFDKYRFVSSEEAMPSFYDAMKALAIHTTNLCELPESYVKRITMKSVTFTYKGDDETMGATMSATMELHHSDSVIALNTPHKPSIPYDPNAVEPYGDKCLSESCVKALWALEHEAQAYIDGERSQMDLFSQANAVPEAVTNEEEEMPIEDDSDPLGINEDDFNGNNIVNFPAASPMPGEHAAL